MAVLIEVKNVARASKKRTTIFRDPPLLRDCESGMEALY